MPFVISFVGYTPVPRYDDVPWLTVRVDESPGPEGPWTQIDLQALVPVDTDPTEPAPRNITTASATLADGWYRLVFTDGVAGETYSEPRHYNNQQPVADVIPTVAEIRSESNIEFSEYEYPPPTGSEVDRLQTKLDESVAELEALLARGNFAVEWEAVENPGAMALLLRTAIRMLVEFNVSRSTQEQVETAADFDLVQSFSIGPISETRRNLSSMTQVLHPWPALNKLLGGILNLHNHGTLEGLDPSVPVIQSVENLNPRKPGWDLMYTENWLRSIFGELRAPGVYRPGDLGGI